MDRIEKAGNLFREGYNCAQAVVMTFDDVLPIDKKTLMNITAAFGGGFAKTRNLCGTVSAIGMVVGLLYNPQGTPEQAKTEVYKKTQQLLAEFTKRNQDLNCGVLLKNIKTVTDGYVPHPRTEEYYKVRPCTKFVADAVEIICAEFNL